MTMMRGFVKFHRFCSQSGEKWQWWLFRRSIRRPVVVAARHHGQLCLAQNGHVARDIADPAVTISASTNNNNNNNNKSRLQFSPLPTKIITSKMDRTTSYRIVFGSCSSQVNGDLSYWERIVDASPDMVILMGDNVYGRQQLTGGLDGAYATLGNHPSFIRAVTSGIPIIATLDDNDYTTGGGEETTSSVVDDGVDHIVAESKATRQYEDAKCSFLRFFHVPSTDQRWTPGRGVYTSHTVWDDTGNRRLVQIILLDVRRHKSPFLQRHTQHMSDGKGDGGGPYVPDHTKNCTMLGIDQWQWLEGQLKEFPAPLLRLIVSPIQVLAQGHGWDCWNLMPHERQRLLKLLLSSDCANKSGTRTVLLSGDRHVAGLYQMGNLVEITSSSLTHAMPRGALAGEVDDMRVGDFVYDNNFGLLRVNFTRTTVNNDGNDEKDNHEQQQQLELCLSIRRADTGEEVGPEWTRSI